MSEDFVLSKKRGEAHYYNDSTYVYSEEDVKEFIRLLKEKWRSMHSGNSHSLNKILFLKEIDKLAGDSLK